MLPQESVQPAVSARGEPRPRGAGQERRPLLGRMPGTTDASAGPRRRAARGGTRSRHKAGVARGRRERGPNFRTPLQGLAPWSPLRPAAPVPARAADNGRGGMLVLQVQLRHAAPRPWGGHSGALPALRSHRLPPRLPQLLRTTPFLAN